MTDRDDSTTRRKPRLVGGTPWAHPPDFGSRMKSVMYVRCAPSTTRTPQLTLVTVSFSSSSEVRTKQLSVHSHTLPARSSNPLLFVPNVPPGWGVVAEGRSREDSAS